MIGEVLPRGVAAEETVGLDPSAYLLHEERHLVARAVESRRRDVTNARTCARRALARLGVAAPAETPILKGDRGEPRWPDGVVGSITHTSGYCAAAVAVAGRVRSLGIDAEVHDRLPKGVAEHVAIAEELAWLEGRASEPICWDRLLFSAKESVYKAWYPLTGRWLGFEDAQVTFDPSSGTFLASLAGQRDGPSSLEPPPSEFAGRFLVRDGIVLTAITVPASPT